MCRNGGVVSRLPAHLRKGDVAAVGRNNAIRKECLREVVFDRDCMCALRRFLSLNMQRTGDDNRSPEREDSVSLFFSLPTIMFAVRLGQRLGQRVF